MPKILEINEAEAKLDSSPLQEAGELLKNGKLVVLPTETVYGIGANALNGEAVKKIFEAKGRPSDNPLIAHINNFDMLTMLAQNIGDIENKLMKAFWPGPLTLILEKAAQVPVEITGGKTNSNNVAVRMPSSVIAQAIITYAGTPIAAPSANKSGKPSGTGIADIFDELKDSVALFIDAGLPDIGVESTVVKVIDGMPTILRPGKITLEDIQDVVGHARLDDSVFSKIDDDTAPSSPGMKYRHYAPDCQCQLIEIADNESKVARVIEIVKKASPEKIVVLCANENVQRYEYLANVCVLPMGGNENHDEIARSLFVNLRKAEAYEPKLVLIEGVKREGLGVALMNRLIRACGYNIVH